MATDQPTQLSIRSAKKFRLQPHPGWLEEPYWPRARLTLLDGKEGIGKGLWCAYLAATVANAGGNVVWLTAEDDPEHDVYPRLLAAGWSDASPGNIYFLEGNVYFPKGIDVLERVVRNAKASLLVLDPGRSFLRNPTTGEARYSSEEDVRPGLQELGKLCIKTEVAGVFVHHWNRASDRETGERYSGSAAFAQVVRHRVTMAWSVSAGIGGYEVSKSNIGPVGFTRSYRVREVPELSTARFEPMGKLPFERLDDWWKYVNRPVTIELEPDEVLEDWLMRNAARLNFVVPSREELRLATRLSQAKVTAAIAALRERTPPLIVQEGKVLRWVGEILLGDGE